MNAQEAINKLLSKSTPLPPLPHQSTTLARFSVTVGWESYLVEASKGGLGWNVVSVTQRKPPKRRA